MRRGDRSPRHRRLNRGVVIVLAFVAAGCGQSAETHYPAVSGWRVQAASVVGESAVPYRVGTYELVFPAVPGEVEQARRAALVVDLAERQGYARGFVEWGRSGEVPLTYAAGGRARQRNVNGEAETVFELALNHVKGAYTTRATQTSGNAPPMTVHVLVNESSGTATLIRRR